MEQFYALEANHSSKSHEHYPHYVIEHMHKKFEINRTKIKGSCQSGRKVETHDSKSDLLLVMEQIILKTLEACK